LLVITLINIESPEVWTRVFGVEANLLNVVKQDLYSPKEIEDITLPSIENC